MAEQNPLTGAPTRPEVSDDQLQNIALTGRTKEFAPLLSDEEKQRLVRVLTRLKQGTPETSPQIERSRNRLERLEQEGLATTSEPSLAAQTLTGSGRAVASLPERTALKAGELSQDVSNFLTPPPQRPEETFGAHASRKFTAAELLLGKTREGLPLPGQQFNARTGEEVASPFGPKRPEPTRVAPAVEAAGRAAGFTARLLAPAGDKERAMAGQFIVNLVGETAKSFGITLGDPGSTPEEFGASIEQAPVEFLFNVADAATFGTAATRRGITSGLAKAAEKINIADSFEEVVSASFDDAMEQYLRVQDSGGFSGTALGGSQRLETAEEAVGRALADEAVPTPAPEILTGRPAASVGTGGPPDAVLLTDGASRLNTQALPRFFAEERRAINNLPLQDVGDRQGVLTQLEQTLRINRNEARKQIKRHITNDDPKGLKWARDIVARRRAIDRSKNLDPGAAPGRRPPPPPGFGRTAQTVEGSPVVGAQNIPTPQVIAARQVESTVRAAEQTVADMADTAHAARLAGADDVSDELAPRIAALRGRIDELHERAGKTAQEQADDMLNDQVTAADDLVPPVPVPEEAPATVGMNAQRGSINTEMAARIGGSSIGATIGSQIGEDGQINVPGAIMGGALGFLITTPNTLSLTKEAPDFEKAISDIIIPLLPETTNPGAARALGTAVAGGAGALVGGFPENEEFSEVGAGLGLVAGLALGSRFTRNLGGLDNFNPRQKFTQLFTEGKGLSPAVQAAKRESLDRVSGRIQEWVDVNRRIANAAKKDKDLGQILHDVSIGEAAPEAIKDAALRQDVATARHLWDEAGVDLIEFGLAEGQAAATIESNLGTYLPRLYLEFERADVLDTAVRWLQKNNEPLTRLSDRNYLKGRKDVPKEIREAWGEIVDNPGLLGLRRVHQVADIEFARYTRQLAASPENVLPQITLKADDAASALSGGKARTFTRGGDNMAEWEGRTYRQLPKNKRLGVLADRYVDEAIADDLETFIEMPSALRRFIDQGTAFFKASKVTFNPATLMRNVYGNIILADQGGLSPRRLGHYKKSFGDYLGQSDRYLEARRQGLFGGEYFGTEVRELLDATERSGSSTVIGALNWVDSKLQGPLDKMARFHEGSEQAWKMAMYNHGQDVLGLSPEAAVRHAKRWIFDYREVPQWIQTMRQSPIGAPFISFSYKALPRVLENAMAVGDGRKLWRFWKYPLALGSINEYSAQRQGLIKDEEKGIWSRVKRVAANGLGLGDLQGLKPLMPDYLGGNQIMLPWRDKWGRQQLLDATWTLPWGDIGEVGKGRVGEAMSKMGIPFPRQLEPSNPWLQITAAALTGGKDPFTGKEIVPIYQNVGDAQLDWARYSFRQFAPTLFPSAGFSATKLEKAGVPPFGLQQDIGSRPDIPTRPVAVLSEIFGIKIRPLAPRQGFEFKRRELDKKINEGQKRIRSLEHDLPRDEGVFDKVRRFLAGEITLSKVPKSARGEARTIEKVRDAIIKDVEKFNEKHGDPNELPELSPQLRKALTGKE